MTYLINEKTEIRPRSAGDINLGALATIVTVVLVGVAGTSLLRTNLSIGSSTQETLGTIAAGAGLASAIFGSVSIALLFRWKKWSEMPTWSRLYTASLGGFVAVTALRSFMDSLTS